MVDSRSCTAVAGLNILAKCWAVSHKANLSKAKKGRSEEHGLPMLLNCSLRYRSISWFQFKRWARRLTTRRGKMLKLG